MGQVTVPQVRHRHCSRDAGEATDKSSTHQHRAPTMIPDPCCINPATALSRSSCAATPTLQISHPLASRPDRAAAHRVAREPDGTSRQTVVLNASLTTSLKVRTSIRVQAGRAGGHRPRPGNGRDGHRGTGLTLPPGGRVRPCHVGRGGQPATASTPIQPSRQRWAAWLYRWRKPAPNVRRKKGWSGAAS